MYFTYISNIDMQIAIMKLNTVTLMFDWIMRSATVCISCNGINRFVFDDNKAKMYMFGKLKSPINGQFMVML